MMCVIDVRASSLSSCTSWGGGVSHSFCCAGTACSTTVNTGTSFTFQSGYDGGPRRRAEPRYTRDHKPYTYTYTYVYTSSSTSVSHIQFPFRPLSIFLPPLSSSLPKHTHAHTHKYFYIFPVPHPLPPPPSIFTFFGLESL